MKTPRLYTALPEYISTPDGMEMDKQGNLLLSCPNYAEPDKPGCIVSISPDKTVKYLGEIAVDEPGDMPRPMGIALGPDGDLYVCDNQGWNGQSELLCKGRILRLHFENGMIARTTVVARGMEHPNGIRIRGEYMYLTQSHCYNVKDPSGCLVSFVYRFHLNDHDLEIGNTLDDVGVLSAFLTRQPYAPGVDGIAFNSRGELFVGNFGDGEIYKLTLNEDGSLKDKKLWAHDRTALYTTDGMMFDADDNLYIADFVANAVVKITPDAKVSRYAQSPDCDGFDGGLDQPSEVLVCGKKLIVTCFDTVTGPGVVNTRHEMPATMSELDID